MCRLTKQVADVNDGFFDDAVVIQAKSGCDEPRPDYSVASAILHKTPYQTDTWSFHPIITVGETTLTGTGVHGTIQDVVSAAYYQLGHNLDGFDFIGVNYCDNSFPVSLMPDKIRPL